MMKKATTAELVARYNKAATTLSRKPVKKFADRKTAELRLAAIEAQLAPVARAGAEYNPDAIGEKRGRRFDLPGRPAKERLDPREGMRRARLLDLLKEAGADGVDFFQLHEQMQKEGSAFGNLKSLRDALGLLSRKNGYAIVGKRLESQAHQAQLVERRRARPVGEHRPRARTTDLVPYLFRERRPRVPPQCPGPFLMAAKHSRH